VQGYSRSPVENARALLHIHSYQKQGLSYDVAVKTAATAELSSPSTLRAVSQQFAATGALTPPRTPVDRSHPLHPFYLGESGPSLEAQLLVHRLLREVALENTFQSCVTLRTELAAHLGIVVSKSTVHRWLHSLGYVYGKKHFVNSDPSYRWTLIRRYIYQYAAALKEQEQDTAIIVYMDESYIHSHHCSKRLWHSLSSATKNEVRGDSKGKRIIIIHAMTKDGLLEVEGTEPSNILTELYHSCALIFDEVCVDGVSPADYHDTINGEKFIGWMRQRLFPTVQRLYPGKKMYLVLDNAKYHHHRGPDWFSPSQKKKGQLADFLRQRNVQCRCSRQGRWTDCGAAEAGCQAASGRASGDQHHGAAAAGERRGLCAAVHSSLRERSAADRDDLGLHQGDRGTAVHPHPHRPGLRRPDARGDGSGQCGAVPEADPSLPHVDRAVHAVAGGRQPAAVRHSGGAAAAGCRAHSDRGGRSSA
jgi:hypothetical protein